MMKKLNSSISLIICFLFLQNIALGLTLSATLENKEFQVYPGETAKFTILFWNVENSPNIIKLRIRQVSGNMSVMLEKEEFTINPSKVTSFPAEKGREYMDTKYGLMLTTPVDVLVNVSESVEPGSYNIYVTATAGKPGSGISTRLEKTFKLTVNVTESPKPEIIQTISKIVDALTDKLTETSKDLTQKITGMSTAATANVNVILLFLSIISILVIAWWVYKRI